MLERSDEQIRGLLLGRILRDVAIERAEAHSPEEWREIALRAIRMLVLERETFTSDDVWRVLDRAGIPRPHENRAMGAIMRAAQKESLVRPTQMFVPSTQPTSHCRPTRVWESAFNG